MKNSEKTMEKLVALCKNRGFIYAGSEIYGGLANSWDYGPLGVELKNNVKKMWWKKFVQESPYNVGLDSAILMNPEVWVASGHVTTFNDPLIDCKACKSRHRADKLIEDWLAENPMEGVSAEAMTNEEMVAFIREHGIPCPVCGKSDFTDIRKFNLMFKTHQGVTEDTANEVYLRPETAQGIFVNFKNIQRTTRRKIPFGVCQIGKSFRNEITPGNFTFRTREFEQMELEFFRDLLRVEDRYFTPEFMELNGCGAFLKAGCVFADRLSTVSPSYANEICTPYFGEGLEGILSARRHQLSGIINGIDTKVFNPFSDQLIPKRFDKGHLKGKQTCKESLMFDMGLHADIHTPLIAMVTRMTPQKGFDLIERVLDEMMYFDICFLLLGSGAKKYETFMREAENRHRGRVCSYIGYNEDLSHRVYAGADMLLMPSRFEPCGLSQMIAMRYGTLPIVRETGGLKDTVKPYNQYTGEGNGFSFANYNAHEMKATVERAVNLYRNEPNTWTNLMKNAMSEDFSFARSAEDYARLYIDML